MKIKLRFIISIVVVAMGFGCRQHDAQPLTFAGGNAVVASGDSVAADAKHAAAKSDELVWVCKSDGATKYHRNRNCGGLSKCKHTVQKQNKKEAEAVGLTLCSFKKCR